MAVTEGEAVRMLVDEWESSAGDVESDTAVLAATALRSMASGVVFHAAFSDEMKPLIDTIQEQVSSMSSSPSLTQSRISSSPSIDTIQEQVSSKP